MFDELLNKLGSSGIGFDPRKVVELVDSLWDSRDKIVASVNFIWENKDSISAAVGFMQNYADDLVDLGHMLPTLLDQAGGALGSAGEGATKASQMLLGGQGNGVSELSAGAADALERANTQLLNAVELIAKAGHSLAALPLVGSAASPIVDGTDKLSNIADDLASVARQVRGLGVTITGAGDDLGKVGQSLMSSGGSLQGLMAKVPPAGKREFVPPPELTLDKNIVTSAAAKAAATRAMGFMSKPRPAPDIKPPTITMPKPAAKAAPAKKAAAAKKAAPKKGAAKK